MPILELRRKSPAERKLDEIRQQIGKLDIDVDLDDVRKRLRHVHLPEVDTDRLQKRLKDVPVPGRHEEPESSSAGFMAGIAVGVVLGIVLSYLFGKGGGSGVMDQFTQRADGLRASAVETVQQVRGTGEAAEADTVDALDDDPAIEREIDGEGDTFVEVEQPVLDATDQTPRTI